MYCILKDVKVYFNFWKQIKYHDVRKTFSLCVVYYNVISSVPPCWWSFTVLLEKMFAKYVCAKPKRSSNFTFL